MSNRTKVLIFGFLLFFGSAFWIVLHREKAPESLSERTTAPLSRVEATKGSAETSSDEGPVERPEPPEEPTPIPVVLPGKALLPHPKPKLCMKVSWHFMATGGQSDTLSAGEQVTYQFLLDGVVDDTKIETTPAEMSVRTPEFFTEMRREVFFSKTLSAVMIRQNGDRYVAYPTVHGFDGVVCR